MTCKCGSDRIIYVYAKCSNLCSVSYKEEDFHGYVPHGIGLGDDSDAVDIGYCADCGSIQGNEFPLPEKIVLDENEENEEENEEEDDSKKLPEIDWENLYTGDWRA